VDDPRERRSHLQSLGIELETLAQTDVVTMSYTLRGWQIVSENRGEYSTDRRTRVVLVALNTRGEYFGCAGS
jgi:hypothetical protein